MAIRNKEKFGGGRGKGFADDVYGQPGHPVWVKRSPVVQSEISVNRGIHMSTEAEIKSRLLNPNTWPIAKLLASSENSTIYLLHLLLNENEVKPISLKALKLKLQELKEKGICEEKLLEGQDGQRIKISYWNLIPKAKELVQEHFGGIRPKSS